MDDLIELVAPGGVDEANHGTERYRVDNSGRVFVPRAAAFWLIRAGGFRVVDPAVPVFTTAEQPSAPPVAPAPAAPPAYGETDDLARVGPPRPRRSVK